MGRGLKCGSLKTFPLTLEARTGPVWHLSRHIHGYMWLVRGCKPKWNWRKRVLASPMPMMSRARALTEYYILLIIILKSERSKNNYSTKPTLLQQQTKTLKNSGENFSHTVTKETANFPLSKEKSHKFHVNTICTITQWWAALKTLSVHHIKLTAPTQLYR